ncbi:MULTISPECIES: type I polyketide synthase [Cyanophyceae]|uniref:Type I polyketide synthase n=1 Tax=Leptolyngbya subtilissima DQ-A4 TaxID=2933933 RepID=A0ABV0K306_9CYAN|nr:type I polyketide synthase [Nodosilinea sp. FACHB-141]MBD2111679.1 alpha/beta fold hydrolase [Nodosilinea sp. FACHB-141]
MEDLARRISSLSPEKRLLLELQLQRKRGLPEPIAIVGMACRLPAAPNLQAYWRLLTEGQDAIREVPADRWDVDALYDADPQASGKTYCRWGGFLDGVDQFDPAFFGITPREAPYIDPQQRLFLESVWEALEDAGIVPQTLSGQPVGVFAAASTLDYGQMLLQGPEVVGTYTATGLASTMVANRVSYLLNLQGPSLTVDTACSSSLVAVHLACQSLWNGESNLALAGGVNLMLTPTVTVGFSKLTALSPEGRCKAFDAAANGFVRSEGVGSVVLKRLGQALADGDRIYALIRGSATNQDGRTNGLTAPNPAAQEAVVKTAYERAGIPLNQVDYIEAHGTGTLLGDPIEAKALGNVFGPFRQLEQPVRLGSVKSNIGHTEAAAGIASLIKVALCLRHRTLVPSLHFHTPNPYIPFDQLPLRVQQQRESWVEAENMAIAGVSSFGFGGTNAHVALQAAPIFAADSVTDRPLHLFCLSARSQPALQAYAQTMATTLAQMPQANLGDLCHTVNAGRTAFDHRLALLVKDFPSLVTALEQYSPPISHPTHPSTSPGVVFLFTGQGSQYVGMGRQLYDTQPVFKAAIDLCDELLQPYLDLSLQSVLFGEDGPEEDSPTVPLHQTGYTQPALFALEYALAQLWLSWGIRPAAVMGHSVGEYVAACVAGVFSLEDGLRLMALRGRLMQTLPANGGMVAVFADADTVAAALPPTVSLATLNGPDNTVIAGLQSDLETVVEDLHAQGIRTKPLQVSHAFHSALMDPILNVFEQSAQGIRFRAPTIPLVSNLTGEFVGSDLPLDARYWRRHARQPVRFADAIATLHQAGYTQFLEVGPHPVLSAMGKRCVAHSHHTWLPSLRRGQSDWHTLLTTLGHLYQTGLAIDWANFDCPYQRQWLSLPTYPFQRQRYWIDLALPNRTAAAPVIDSAPEPVPSAAYSLTWQPQAIASAPRADGDHWLIWGASDALWANLSQALQKRGITPIQVSAGDRFATLQPDHYQVLLGAEQPFHPLLEALKPQAITTLLVLAPEGDLDPEAVTGPVLHWVKALAHQSGPAMPKLWLVTQGAQTVDTTDVVTSPHQALLWGLGRSLRLEHPEFWGGLVDLPSQGAASEQDVAPWLDHLVAHVNNPQGEDEVALRQQQSWVPRLQTMEVASEPVLESGAPPIQAEATYLITGGTGALGQQLAGWLVKQGARHLVLTSRRGSDLDLEKTLAPLRQAGATVWVEAVDGGDRAALSTLLNRIQQQLPPLRGVFHAAGVLADGFVANQSTEHFHQVMPGKLQAAWHLHQLTQTFALDWFVLFSSITSVLGSPGQGNYGAANAGLDALAHYRRQRGFPALSINWGPWQGAGMATRQSATALTQRGMPPLAASEGLQWLGRLLAAKTPATVAIAHLDWPRLLRYLPIDRPPAIVSAFGTKETTAPAKSDKEAGLVSNAQKALPSLKQILALPEAQQIATVQTYLQAQVATVMGLSEQVPLDAPLMELGIDSLMTMELLALCKQDLDLVLYPREVLAHPTVAALSSYIARELVRVHRPAASVEASPSLAPAEFPEETVTELPKSPWQSPAPLEPLPTRRNPPMVFLLSAPRSGSTLLRVMLAGHPGLFCPPELHLLPFNTLEAQGAALGYSYLQEGLQRAVMELLQVNAEQAETLLSEWRQHHTTVPAVYDKLQQMAGGRLLVDKSPTYSLSLETLERAEQIFEGAKYIHLVRHPYSVISSFVHNRMYKIFDLEPDDPYRLAEQVWQACNQNIRTFASSLDPERHYTLRYEDLVVDPEPAMRGLCTFLDLPFDPAVLTPYEGRRMTDGVTAQSMAVDDPNFRQRSRIEAHLAKIWQGIQLPHRLSTTSQTLAAQFDYPLPQEQAVVPASAPLLAEPAPLSTNYVPLGAMREEEILLRGRPCCLCHWGPENGPQVVCLHGILEHGAAWDGVATTLADQGYHVIAPDLRGHGRSAHAGSDGGYQLLDFLSDLDSLTATLGTQPFVLVGHSMGAVLGAILTSLRPERVQRLVLIEPVVPAPGPSLEPATQLMAHLDALANSSQPTVIASVATATQRLLALKPYLSQPMAEAMAQRLTQTVAGGVIWRSDPRLKSRTTLSLSGGLLDRQGYGQILQGIQRPTTVIFGQSSQFNRPEDLAFLQENLPQADQVSLAGGHDLPLETPGGLARIIHATLASEGQVSVTLSEPSS